MIRVFDFFLSLISLILSVPILATFAILIFISGENPIFIQVRLGARNINFNLIKLRTLKSDTPNTATHDLAEVNYVFLGKFLRKTKLDELPQLINVLLGDMSLVGYRPCLPSQSSLVELRNKYMVSKNRPGITGLAQVLGVDMSTPRKLVRFEKIYEGKKSFSLYLFVLKKTFLGRIKKESTPTT